MVRMIIALWLAATTNVASPDALLPARPLQLVTEASGKGMRIYVVGTSAVLCDASYDLEVSSGSTFGANRSIQRGAARIKPGVEAKVLTMTLAKVDPGGWSVRLRVTPCGAGTPYEETRGQPQ